MKSLFLLFVLFALTLRFSEAQVSHFSFGTGYGLPMGAQYIGDNSIINDTGSSEQIITEGVYGSYGGGIVLQATYGYSFSKVIGIDITAQFANGKRYETGYIEYFQGSPTRGYDFSNAISLLLNPSVTITVDRAGLKPYFKLGLVTGIISVTNENSTKNSPQNSSRKVIVSRGGFPIGMSGAAGLDIPLKDKLALFVELSFTSMSYPPGKYEVTAF